MLRRWPVVHGHSKVCKPPAQFAFWIFIPKPSIPHFVFWVFTVNSFSAGGTCGVFSLWTSPTSQLRSSPYKCTVCCIHIMTRGYFTLFMIFSYFFCHVHVLLWSNSPSHSTCHDFQNEHNLPAAWWAVTVQSQPNMKQGSSNYRRTNRRMNEWMDWTGLGAGDRKSVAFRFYGRTLAALQRGL